MRTRTSVEAARNAEKLKRVSNPLLLSWKTPFGIAPFDRIKPLHFLPAFEAAIAEHAREIRKIADRPAKPSFANTIVALEKSGRHLNQVCDVFFNLTAADTSPELQLIERDIAPRLAQHQNEIYLDAAVFERIEDLFERRDKLKLDGEQRRILERTHSAFVRAGARLKGKAKKRIAVINERLATLVTRFNQNILQDEQSWRLVLDNEDDLAGLPPEVRAAAARVAADLGFEGKHAITLARSSVESFLQFSARRDLRQDAFNAWVKRGENGGETDNRAIVTEIVRLRAEMARLLGFKTYAEYSLEDTMAKTPGAVRGLLEQVWSHAVNRATEERAALQSLAKSEGANFKIEAWDWRYYTEKERKARYDLDESEIRVYLPLDRMIDAAFDTATRLFGLTFEERHDLPVYHPDVRVWEVRDRAGKHAGLFLGDYFARPSKRSGAWMSSFRTQHNLTGEVRPIIVNVLNVARGAQGGPALLSFDDARTLFHEFGHGLHGLLSDVTYPSLSGTNVSRDFVELPSQLYEHWLSAPEVLKRYARHHKTGKPIPNTLLARLKKARTFNQGFATVEYTASALVDMDLHALQEASDLDVGAFERETLKRIGMPKEIVMRHRLPHFMHIMGGYAAGYYSYLWSEVMDADAFAAFEETGDVFDAGVAARLAEHIYKAGNRRDPQEAYVAFRGRAPSIEGLLKKRGFVNG